MRPVEILSCLGATADDPRVQALLKRFAISRQPQVALDEVTGEVTEVQDWLPCLPMGIEFGFEDEASLLGAPEVEWGSGPMLLTEVYFYAAHPGPSCYGDDFPFGLQPGEDRAMVRARMEQARAPLRWRGRDTWGLPAFDFTVDYGDGTGGFAYAVAILRPVAPQPDPEIRARCPAIAELAAVLGHSLSDELLDKTLARTGYARAMQMMDPTRAWSDLSHEMGLELEFGQLPGVSGLALDRVTLLGDRRLGTRVWPGELPRGLLFGSSWHEIVAAAGREPEVISEQDFLLTAFWRSGNLVIEAEYSTMINSLLAMSLVYGSPPG
jgi:hypothetical protein